MCCVPTTIGAVQLAAVALAAMAATESSDPRLGRYVTQLIVITVLWLAVVVLDLLAFPTTNMVRFLLGEVVVTAGFVAALQLAFVTIAGFFDGAESSFANDLAGAIWMFFVWWALLDLRQPSRAKAHA